MYGLIESDWKKTNSRFQLRVIIPVNTTAEIWLKASEQDTITVNGNGNLAAVGITTVRHQDGYTVLSVGSGVYQVLVDR